MKRIVGRRIVWAEPSGLRRSQPSGGGEGVFQVEGAVGLRVSDWNEFGMCDQEHTSVAKP